MHFETAPSFNIIYNSFIYYVPEYGMILKQIVVGVRDMFGYVKTYQPELKMGEFEQYRGVYCSLCKQLGKSYGFWSRMTLSYDFTFLALFHMALTPDCCGFEKSRCTFNPMKKCLFCRENDSIRLASDAAALLMYHKLRDSVADDGFWKRWGARFLLLFAKRARRKAAARLPELDELMTTCMQRQADLEKERCPSLDAAADPTATILAALASLGAGDEAQKQVRERFGYCLGRWIYLMDALDDLEEDLACNRYNPYAISRGLYGADSKDVAQAKEYALLTLNACAAECVDSYDKLTVYRFDGILRNVLQLGMPTEQKRIVNGNGGQNERKQSV